MTQLGSQHAKEREGVTTKEFCKPQIRKNHLLLPNQFYEKNIISIRFYIAVL